MTLCLPTPGTAQYISYLLFVVSFNWNIKIEKGLLPCTTNLFVMLHQQ